MAFDMRFAAIGRAWFSQPETRMGIIPGGGGDLYDAQTAEKYGWINLALPADQLDAYAHRMALRPEQIAAA